MAPSPIQAWAAVQAASVWNATERALRRAWYAMLKGVFVALMDDADLYPFLWGRSWSWVWLLAPLAAALLAGLSMLALWSFQVRTHLPAAGPWLNLPMLVATLGALLGFAAGLDRLPGLPRSQPWPVSRALRLGLDTAGPFLHPGCLLALMVGLAAATPWVVASSAWGPLLLVLPVLLFRAGLELALPLRKVRRQGGFHLGSHPSAERTFRRLIRNLPGRGMGWLGLALVAALVSSGHLLVGFGALAYFWALVQADVLRLEGSAAALVALWPAAPQRKLDARLTGVAQWASKAGFGAWIALLLRFGPAALLPGALSLLEAHWMGAALGLSASAAAPLEGWSLLSLQSLGLAVSLGGLLPGWLLQNALASPWALLAQLLATALTWALLQRTKSRVLADWSAIQESLIEG